MAAPGVYPSKKKAREMLNQQPFTAACRARHEIAPVYERNLLGEKISDRPVGYCYRLNPRAK